eukprot:COSAG02_NODE_18319_length_945_cov_182.109195_2_plen_42_part_01
MHGGPMIEMMHLASLHAPPPNSTNAAAAIRTARHVLRGAWVL